MSNHESLKTVLSPELEQFTDPDKIAANKGNYPEFGWNPDRHEQVALEHVRNMFLDIDLSHATDSNPESLQRDGILPFASLVDSGRYDYTSQTYELDISLGLHRYVFMHWGAFYPTCNGSNIFPVDTREVLLSSNTVVTPHDINDTMCYCMCTEASALDEDGRERLDKYLDTILSGNYWLEVVARRALRYMQSSSRRDFYPIEHHTDMGEIKYLGAVSPKLMGEPINVYNEKAMRSIWRSMIEENGVMMPSMYVTGAADTEKSRKRWRDILDIAQKS